LGADPALLGFIMRPASVERHTYENIKSQKHFTVNAVTKQLSERAHSTSARYPRGVSEFEACRIDKAYLGDFSAPFVKESPVKIGCVFREEMLISSNSTILIVGEIVTVHLDGALLGHDGYVDLARADIAAISALDGYHSVGKPTRYAYAKPNTDAKTII
jgi:flavin reductase (DIM6/NTAB) family NADH-FMN oxidoreductase RutF